MNILIANRFSLLTQKVFQSAIFIFFWLGTVNIMAADNEASRAERMNHMLKYRPAHVRFLSFHFQNISVRDLLQIIAKNAGLNFIISDSVKGTISLSLDQVTWKKALDVIMRTNGLDSRQYDNVIFIAPIEEMATDEAKRLQTAKQLADMALPTTAFIHLRYANADEVIGVLKSQQGSLLSPNGQVGSDLRTNMVWIYDTPANLVRIRTFIRQLDVPSKQVLIEARIVSVDERFVEDLGIRWGLSTENGFSGTLTGANDTRQLTTLPDVPVDDRLNFNVPAQAIFGATPASMAVALLRMGNTYLDMEISALEGEGKASIISNPRVITANMRKANIQTGTEIPYQEATSSGATSVSFKKAVLSLEITPQITSSVGLILNIKVTRNKRGLSIQTGPTTTIPSIDTEEVESLVLLKNNQTVVLGGVYELNKSDQVERVPFLGTLPIIGRFFRHTNEDNQRKELLVFITPKIINQPLSLTENERKLNKLSLQVSSGEAGVKDKKKDKNKNS